jgi:hypothetical protein
MIATTESPLRLCYACGEVQPIENFRLRRHGSPARQGLCRVCYNKSMREYRNARRRKRLRRFAAQLRRARSLERVAGVVNGTIAHLGGLDGFTRLWAESLETGSPATRLRAFRALVQTTALLEERQGEASKASLSAMSDEEIERELRALLGPVAGVLD